MLGNTSGISRPRIRRARVDFFAADLDLSTQVVSLFWHRLGKPPTPLGEGTWTPLPAPMGNLRGTLVSECIHRRTCMLLEYRLARGNPGWSYESGPWLDAETAARTAGVGTTEAATLRKVLWLFYRNRWPLRFSEGCGWGAEGYAPLIAAALADPAHTRARWELLIRTGALQWPHHEGDLDKVEADVLHDDFYATP